MDKYLTKFSSEGLTEWIVGDSVKQVAYFNHKFDMVFTCPPYYNLEKYTDIPGDISNFRSYRDFRYKYSQILNLSAFMLEDDSFFVIVVGEIRNPETGEYYGLVPDTIRILRDAGLKYYNEIILENNIGSLPIRAPKYFDQSRKIGKMHQNVLVFFKGDPSKIEQKYGKFSEEK